jgi:hypothetical protein
MRRGIVSNKIISSEEEIKNFLSGIKEILTDPSFNVDVDLDILMKKKTESPTDPYTTANTLLALDFDKYDVLNQLLSLEVSDYLETFIDDLDSRLPPFFAFVKEIKKKDVYIKVKIRDKQKHKIFCVSFHFARYTFPRNLPYR